MQFKTMIVLHLFLLIIFAFTMVFLIKKGCPAKIVAPTCVAVVIVMTLTVLFHYKNSSSLNGFEEFSSDNLSRSTAMIEDLLIAQADDIGDQLASADGLENKVMLGSFDLTFRNNSFSNLQFTILFSERGGLFEKTYQVNYIGQVFLSPKTLTQSDSFTENTVPLIVLKNIIERLSKSDIFQTFYDNPPINMRLMFNGQTMEIPYTTNTSNIYVIEKESVIPLSQAIHQEHSHYYVYYVFSIVTERDSFQIVYPQVVN